MSEDYKSRKVTCRTIHNEPREATVGELTFRPSAYGVILKDDAVLLVPQWDGYDFPGGGIHEGEPLLDALVREIKEESGIDATPGEILLATDDFFIHPRNDRPYHTILLFFACEAVGGELSDAGFTEFERTMSRTAEWVPIETALTAKFRNPIDSPALIRKAVEAQRNK